MKKAPALYGYGAFLFYKPSQKRILVQDQGGFEFQTGGIRLYVGDLEPGSNTGIGPKDFFEMACNNQGDTTS